eukprot:7607474-Heterocapsa_arctica.AAC.1
MGSAPPWLGIRCVPSGNLIIMPPAADATPNQELQAIAAASAARANPPGQGLPAPTTGPSTTGGRADGE